MLQQFHTRDDNVDNMTLITYQNLSSVSQSWKSKRILTEELHFDEATIDVRFMSIFVRDCTWLGEESFCPKAPGIQMWPKPNTFLKNWKMKKRNKFCCCPQIRKTMCRFRPGTAKKYRWQYKNSEEVITVILENFLAPLILGSQSSDNSWYFHMSFFKVLASVLLFKAMCKNMDYLYHYT